MGVGISLAYSIVAPIGQSTFPSAFEATAARWWRSISGTLR